MMSRTFFAVMPENLLASCPFDRAGRIVKINDGNNTGDEWNPVGFETLRVAAAIPFLMVKAHDIFYRIGKADALQNIAAHRGVNLHFCELGFRQFSRFVKNVFWYCELSDVV